MLREQLRRRAGQAVQSMWQRAPKEELTSEIEQEIVEEVRKMRLSPEGRDRLLYVVDGLLRDARARRTYAAA